MNPSKQLSPSPVPQYPMPFKFLHFRTSAVRDTLLEEGTSPTQNSQEPQESEDIEMQEESPHYPAWGFNPAVLLPVTSTVTSTTATATTATSATTTSTALATSATTTSAIATSAIVTSAALATTATATSATLATSAAATSAAATFATSATLATAASATTTAPASRAEYPEWNFDPSVLLRNTSTVTAETATSKPYYPEWSFDPAVLLSSTSAKTAAAAAPSRTVKSAMRQTRKVYKRSTQAIDKSVDLDDEAAPGPSSSGRKRVRFVAEDEVARYKILDRVQENMDSLYDMSDGTPPSYYSSVRHRLWKSQ
ncbi:hypothetical protein WOLCODRAFT_150573 [Wolfiporia cocos MD-104 SS10]|uniref:Uncharacterized protein n=1 Tax=Wolfiporia cocos (strain MD-104) TaxID=742152 RepID=A0A2H3JRX1_WOLCO|nr:hypothetical protein WOLCODRAFT_150573 [Wolfiporia cocos MD-104 SS10]